MHIFLEISTIVNSFENGYKLFPDLWYCTLLYGHYKGQVPYFWIVVILS
jgi:hypothetical protein